MPRKLDEIVGGQIGWDFERVTLAHGELITEDARHVVEQAWRRILPS